MGAKAKGKKLSNHPVSSITWLDPISVEEEEEIETEEELAGEVETETEIESAPVAEPVDIKPEAAVELNKEIPPPAPPDFPEEDDDAGMGIQLALF